MSLGLGLGGIANGLLGESVGWHIKLYEAQGDLFGL